MTHPPMPPFTAADAAVKVRMLAAERKLIDKIARF